MRNWNMLRDKVKDALNGLSLDNPLLCSFYEAFLFRCSVPTTFEGMPGLSESERVRKALESVFRGILCWEELNFSFIYHEKVGAVPSVEFKINILSAIYSLADLQLGFLAKTVFELAGTVSIQRILESALYSYIQNSRNSLDPQPW